MAEIRVKICGLRRPEDVAAVAGAGAAYAGFVFFPKSPRHVTLDLAGQMRFGPDVEWLDVADAAAIDYRVDPARLAGLADAIRRYWPALPDGALSPAYAGVRPKIGGPDARIPIVRWVDDDGIHQVRTHRPTALVTELSAHNNSDEIPNLEIVRPSLEDIYLGIVASVESTKLATNSLN